MISFPSSSLPTVPKYPQLIPFLWTATAVLTPFPPTFFCLDRVEIYTIIPNDANLGRAHAGGQ